MIHLDQKQLMLVKRILHAHVPERRSELRYTFAESDLSIRVDVLEWAGLSPSFRRAIERTPVEIVQEPTLSAPLSVS